MKRRILAMWAWLTGWFRAEAQPVPEHQWGDFDNDVDFTPGAADDDTASAAAGHVTCLPVPSTFVFAAPVNPQITCGGGLLPGHAAFPVTVGSFKPSDDEVEAARRMRERSENMHKQPCRAAIDARIEDLEQQLASERARRTAALLDLEAARGQVDVFRVGDGHTRAALTRAFPKARSRTEILAERVVDELLKLRSKKRAKPARRKIRTR